MLDHFSSDSSMILFFEVLMYILLLISFPQTLLVSISLTSRTILWLSIMEGLIQCLGFYRNLSDILDGLFAWMSSLARLRFIS